MPQLSSTILLSTPFLIFNHFSSPFEKEKETRQTENFPPRHCSHDAPREERIVKIKKKRERKENREREGERDVVTRGPRQRTGCNSQIYYFSPLVSGAYFTPKRQTGCAARERISQLLRRVFTPAGYISGSLIRTDFTGRLCMRPTVDADQEDNVVEPFPTRINPIDFTRGDRKNPPSRSPLPFLSLLADYC